MSDMRQYGYDDNDSGSRHEYMPSQHRLRVCCFCREENHKADRCRYGQQVRCLGCDSWAIKTQMSLDLGSRPRRECQ